MNIILKVILYILFIFYFVLLGYVIARKLNKNNKNNKNDKNNKNNTNKNIQENYLDYAPFKKLTESEINKSEHELSKIISVVENTIRDKLRNKNIINADNKLIILSESSSICLCIL